MLTDLAKVQPLLVNEVNMNPGLNRSVTLARFSLTSNLYWNELEENSEMPINSTNNGTQEKETE